MRFTVIPTCLSRPRWPAFALMALVMSVIGVAWMPSTAEASVVAAAPGMVAPGENIWFDAAGNRIAAHSGYFVKSGTTWYWFGMKEGSSNFAGVNVYTSTDLVNWTFDRIALGTQGTGDVSGSYPVYRPAVIYNSGT